MIKKMADNGAPLESMYCFVNSYNKQMISSIYGYAPEAKTEGGVNIQTILTDFCELNVVYEPSIAAGTLAVVDLAYCDVVGLPVPEKGIFFYEDLAKAGAAEKGQLYGQLGIGYGHETFHGKITNLATSAS